MAESITSALDTVLEDLLQNPEFIRAIYYGVIMVTGFMILAFLSQPNYQFGRSILFMSAWLILVIFLQPPELAEMESKPFEDTGVVS